MSRVAHFVDAVVGGDTHVDTTSLCVVSPVGAMLAEITIDNDEDGYAQAVTWVLQTVPSERFLVGLEGTRSYGAGLCRALQAVGIRVVEVERPSRGERGRRGKSDAGDALLAANKVLAMPADRVPQPLEDDFEVWLLNPKHVKILRNRKTDVLDSKWLAELTAYGLIRPSFVPPRPIRGLRDTTRYRTALVRERTREVQRLHKVLEEAGIKLSLVASDINGASGTAMLQALIEGQSDPRVLADLAKGSLREKIPRLVEALTGDFTRLHGLMCKRMMQRIRHLDHDIADIEIQIQVQLLPYEQQARRLMTIPGVGEHVAAVIIAEMGVDMSQFPSAAHVASWAGLCPGMNESAGRRKSTATRKGSPHLRGALGDAAWAASRTKNTYLADSHRRIAKRRGALKATVATSRKIAEAAYYILAHGVDYKDLGPDYLAHRRNPQRRAKQLIHELARMGYQVQVAQPAA